MKINYIKVYPNNSNVGTFSIRINGYIDAERLIPIIDGDKFTLKREPFDGDKRSRKVNFLGGKTYSFGCTLPLDSVIGEQLYPCEYESNEDEIVFWI